jgi:hypothetical protein
VKAIQLFTQSTVQSQVNGSSTKAYLYVVLSSLVSVTQIVIVSSTLAVAFTSSVKVTTGTVLSKIILVPSLTVVTATQALVATSVNAILNATAPAVSLASAVYTAVHVFHSVLVTTTVASVMASPPAVNVTTGLAAKVSSAVNVRVISFHTLAYPVLPLEAIDTHVSVGLVASMITSPPLSVTPVNAILGFSRPSFNMTLASGIQAASTPVCHSTTT